jgi:hypothetical protein
VKSKPIYRYQCVEKCKKYIYTENTLLKCCGKLTQWVEGIEGKGINMASPKVKIKVGGYIEMSQENLDILLSHNDPHKGIVFSIPMGYVNTEALEFETIE